MNYSHKTHIHTLTRTYFYYQSTHLRGLRLAREEAAIIWWLWLQILNSALWSLSISLLVRWRSRLSRWATLFSSFSSL